MRTKKLALIPLIFLAWAAPAHATGEATNVRITVIDVRSDGKFLITISAPMTGTTACRTSDTEHDTRFTGDTNSNGGKALLATASAALLARRPVSVQGFNPGKCNEYPGYESMTLLQMK